ELPAGRYETLLPPSAVADLSIFMLLVASARDAADGRTVFSAPRGEGSGNGTKVGSRIGIEGLRLWSDPSAPGLEAAPFNIARYSSGSQSVFDNGLALEPVDWVRDGVLERLVTTRHSAAATGLPLAPPGDNLLMEGSGGADAPGLEEMTRSTDRGLLLTCLWYIREVDPQSLLLTGLTRDGVYLVEGGEVTGVVNNFRFNESPVDLLGRVAASSACRASGPTTSPAPRCRRCGSGTSTCPRCRRPAEPRGPDGHPPSTGRPSGRTLMGCQTAGTATTSSTGRRTRTRCTGSRPPRPATCRRSPGGRSSTS